MDKVVKDLFPEGFFSTGQYKKGLTKTQYLVIVEHLNDITKYAKISRELNKLAGDESYSPRFIPKTEEQKLLFDKLITLSGKMERTNLSGFSNKYVKEVIAHLANTPKPEDFWTV